MNLKSTVIISILMILVFASVGYGQVDAIKVAVVRASDYQMENVPLNTLDNDLQTRWSTEGDGQWISYEFDKEIMISFLQM